MDFSSPGTKHIMIALLLAGLLAASACTQLLRTAGIMESRHTISPIDPRVSISGRAVQVSEEGVRFAYPGVSLTVQVQARALDLLVHSDSGDNYLDLQIDGQPAQALRLARGKNSLTLFDDDQLQSRQLTLTHRTEARFGTVTLEGFLVKGGDLLAAPPKPLRKLLIVGDSVTCGEAVERDAQACEKQPGWWNARRSYGMLLADALEAEVHLVCAGGRGLIRSWNGRTDELNGPDFFELSLAEDVSQPWNHDDYQPDLVLVSLGTNDFSENAGAMPMRELFVEAYLKFIDRLRAVHPEAQIAITEGAIVNNNNPQHQAKATLRAYLQEVEQRAGGGRVHFLPATHYPGDDCDAHPTAEQHAAMARDLTQQLRPLMGW